MSSCTPNPTIIASLPSPATATQIDPPQPTAMRIDTPLATVEPTIQPKQTATTISLPTLTWHSGDNYFSINGRPAFLFSRNPAGWKPEDWATLAGMAHQQGDQFVRVFTTTASMGGSHGYGYTPTGEIIEEWSNNWEHFFDVAEADGLYVLPSFWGWINWDDSGFKDNPFNNINGGPAKDPQEIFKKDSPTQLLYLKWFKNLVTRWQKHKNILVWEVASEVNLIKGITQPEGIYLAEQLAKVVRETDTLHRPVTTSVADWSGWSDLLHSDAVDFINFHPYPPDGALDHRILEQVPLLLNTYHKPILIGESGLNAAVPDSADGKNTIAPNARTGIQHAIWAQLMSGAINGRALWWEDGYGIYFSALGMPWVKKYTDVEAPILRFADGVDMTGFKPITAKASGKIFGAALGNEEMVIGWYRDVSSEPPNWWIQPVITKQTVNINPPGIATQWKVDFYDTKNGTTIVGSVMVNRIGNKLTIPLPDFKDDIAFKMTAQPGSITTPVSVITTDPIAGKWSGTISNSSGTFSTVITLEIQSGCKPGKECGIYSTPKLSCTGKLFLKKVDREKFTFVEQGVTGGASCASGGYEYLQPLANGTLSYSFSFAPDSSISSMGILQRP